MTTLTATLEHALPTLFASPAPKHRVSGALKRLDKLAWFLDDALPVPFTSRRVGADAVMGTIPGVGSLVAGVVQMYVVVEALRMGVPRGTVAKMVGNVALDTAVGAIPIAGTVFDFFFKATRRNVRLLSEALKAG